MIVVIAVVIIVGVLLCLPISVEVRYIGEEFNLKVKYAFITFYPKKEKPQKPKDKPSKGKAKGTSQKGKTSKDEKESKPKVKSTQSKSDTKALDTLNLVLDAFIVLKRDLGKFITSVRFTNLYINFQVADPDAYECALKFGKLNAILGNVLGFLSWNFKVKKDSITVVPKYNSEDSIYDVSFKVKLGVGKGLGRIVVMLFKVLPILKKHRLI